MSKTVIEMAREAGLPTSIDGMTINPLLERFAALVRKDEREKQQELDSSTSGDSEPGAWALMHKNGLEFNSEYGMRKTLQEAEDMQRRHLGNLPIVPLYTAPPTAALAARQMRDAILEYLVDSGTLSKDGDIYKTIAAQPLDQILIQGETKMNTNPTCSKSYTEGFQQGKQVMFDTFKAGVDELLGTDRMSDGSVLLTADDLSKHEQSMCILKRLLGE